MKDSFGSIVRTLFWAGVILLALMTSWAVFILLLPSLGYIIGSQRRRREATVLGYIEQAVRLNLPLPQLLWAAHSSEEGKVARRLGDLVVLVGSGTPLAAALASAVPEARPRTLALVEAGERLGRLPDALGRLIDEQGKAMRRQSSEAAFMLAYPMAVLTFIIFVVGVIMTCVIPKFKQIFLDFKADLPATTKGLLSFSDWFANDFGWVLFLFLLIGCFVALCGRGLIRMPAGGMLREILDRLIWCIPLAHAAAVHRGLADVCHVAADATELGRPLPEALAEAEQLQLNVVLTGRITRWRQAMEAGQSLSAAARGAGLPALLVGMLATVRAADSAPAVFRFLARYYAGRFSRIALLLRGATVPAMTLGFAAIVAWVILSVFLPMMRLIEAAGQWPVLR